MLKSNKTTISEKEPKAAKAPKAPKTELTLVVNKSLDLTSLIDYLKELEGSHSNYLGTYINNVKKIQDTRVLHKEYFSVLKDLVEEYRIYEAGIGMLKLNKIGSDSLTDDLLTIGSYLIAKNKDILQEAKVGPRSVHTKSLYGNDEIYVEGACFPKLKPLETIYENWLKVDKARNDAFLNSAVVQSIKDGDIHIKRATDENKLLDSLDNYANALELLTEKKELLSTRPVSVLLFGKHNLLEAIKTFYITWVACILHIVISQSVPLPENSNEEEKKLYEKFQKDNIKCKLASGTLNPISRKVALLSPITKTVSNSSPLNNKSIKINNSVNEASIIDLVERQNELNKNPIQDMIESLNLNSDDKEEEEDDKDLALL